MSNDIQPKVVLGRVLGRAMARLLRPHDASVAPVRGDSNAASVRAILEREAPNLIQTQRN